MKTTTAYSAGLLAALATTVLATDFQKFALVAVEKDDKDKKVNPVSAWSRSFYYNREQDRAGVYNKTGCNYEMKDMTEQTQFSYDFDPTSNTDASLELNVLKPDGQQGTHQIFSHFFSQTEGHRDKSRAPVIYPFEPSHLPLRLSKPPTLTSISPVYISPVDGALKFKDTKAPSPANPILSPFNFTGAPNEATPHGKLEVPGCDVIACPDEGKSFKLFAKQKYEETHPDDKEPPKYGEKPAPVCKDVELLTVVAEGEPVYEYDSEKAPEYKPAEEQKEPPKYGEEPKKEEPKKEEPKPYGARRMRMRRSMGL